MYISLLTCTRLHDSRNNTEYRFIKHLFAIHKLLCASQLLPVRFVHMAVTPRTVRGHSNLIACVWPPDVSKSGYLCGCETWASVKADHFEAKFSPLSLLWFTVHVTYIIYF